MKSSFEDADNVAALLRAIVHKGCFREAVASIPGISDDNAAELLLRTADLLEEVDVFPLALSPGGGKISGTSKDDTYQAKGVKPCNEKVKYPFLRVFTDGASRGNPGPAGAGAVILDSEGRIVARVGKYLGKSTNNVAEYEAIVLGLTRAGELGARKIELLSDSELLVHQLTGKYRVRAVHLRPFFDKVRALLKNFEDYRIRHIPREKNSEADDMANKAIDKKMK